ncbi:hypothetical protein CPLU01_07092 [Colletotrichum plurivorum]|uniref:Uncharacterized protein n=1 Tax=Colletotrichum plurivorum TaxID=2175906 RepID=A0A8H6KH63_9PEZI|nr:hypothetical protein CPLU01_07092 [Colletotrichum plurivorum]
MGTGSLAVSKAIISHDGALQRGVMSSAGRLANEADGVSRGCVGRTDMTESTMRGRMGEGLEGVRRMDRESMTDSTREDQVLYKTGGRGIRDMGRDGIPCGGEATVLEPGDHDGYETGVYHVEVLQTVALAGTTHAVFDACKRRPSLRHMRRRRTRPSPVMGMRPKRREWNAENSNGVSGVETEEKKHQQRRDRSSGGGDGTNGEGPDRRQKFNRASRGGEKFVDLLEVCRDDSRSPTKEDLGERRCWGIKLNDGVWPDARSAASAYLGIDATVCSCLLAAHPTPTQTPIWNFDNCQEPVPHRRWPVDQRTAKGKERKGGKGESLPEQDQHESSHPVDTAARPASPHGPPSPISVSPASPTRLSSSNPNKPRNLALEFAEKNGSLAPRQTGSFSCPRPLAWPGLAVPPACAAPRALLHSRHHPPPDAQHHEPRSRNLWISRLFRDPFHHSVPASVPTLATHPHVMPGIMPRGRPQPGEKGAPAASPRTPPSSQTGNMPREDPDLCNSTIATELRML